jgi:hypothetical protein
MSKTHKVGLGECQWQPSHEAVSNSTNKNSTVKVVSLLGGVVLGAFN